MKKTLLYSLFLFFIFLQFGLSQCLQPQNVFTSNIGQTSAVLSWTDPNANSGSTYEISIAPAGGAFGNPLISTSNPFVITGLTPCTSYFGSITTNCTPTSISDSVGFTFSTTCNGTNLNQPQNLSQCIDGQTGLVCFDLNVNNAIILNGNNPSNYTITYHFSQAEAANDFNPLASPYCVDLGTNITLFARVEDSNGQLIQLSPFTISAQNYIVAGSLSPITQCDANNDNTVIYDLTTIQAQISTLNQLQYYFSLANAQDQYGPIANPTAYSVVATSPVITIFVVVDIN